LAGTQRKRVDLPKGNKKKRGGGKSPTKRWELPSKEFLERSQKIENPGKAKRGVKLPGNDLENDGGILLPSIQTKVVRKLYPSRKIRGNYYPQGGRKNTPGYVAHMEEKSRENKKSIEGTGPGGPKTKSGSVKGEGGAVKRSQGFRQEGISFKRYGTTPRSRE